MLILKAYKYIIILPSLDAIALSGAPAAGKPPMTFNLTLTGRTIRSVRLLSITVQDYLSNNLIDLSVFSMSESLPASAFPESLEAEVLRLRAENAEQSAQITQLLARIQEFEARPAKDDHNSSKPPSFDPPFKNPKSRCQGSGKPPGGPTGHPGATRALVDASEHTIIVLLGMRLWMGSGGDGGGGSARTPSGDRSGGASGSDRVSEGVRCMRLQSIPSQPVTGGGAHRFSPVRGFGCSLVTWGRKAAVRLAAPVAVIGQAVRSAVVHADETGLRGVKALTDIGLPNGFRGILVHDHWRAYLITSAQHAFCDAHHLRKLIAIAAGLKALPTSMIEGLLARYDHILADVACFHPRWRPPRAVDNGSSRGQPTTSLSACAHIATRCCASSPICASPSITTSPNAICTCPSSQTEGFGR